MNGKKKIAFVIAGILLVIIIAAIVAITSIDISRHKTRMEKVVSEAIGLQVRIGGTMGISYFPVGVTAADVHIGNKYGEVLSVAKLNARGCAKFSQKISGPFSDPQIGTVSTLQSIAGPIINLFNKAKDLIEGGRCEVFYKGSVRHPQ